MFHKSTSASLSRIRTVVEEKKFLKEMPKKIKEGWIAKHQKSRAAKKTINRAGTRSSTGNHEC